MAGVLLTILKKNAAQSVVFLIRIAIFAPYK